MEVIHYFSTLIHSVAGPWGSPIWYLIGACAITIFFAKWARGIRTLLPFLGAFSVIFLVMWALTGIGVVKWNLT